MRPRPSSVSVAAVLMVILGLVNLAGPAMPSQGVPAAVIYLGVVLGILGVIASVGLWRLSRWGYWLTIVVSILNILSAAPGVGAAPIMWQRLAAGLSVVLFALILLLVLTPSARRAFRGRHAAGPRRRIPPRTARS